MTDNTPPATLTVAEINQLTKYANNTSAYQMIRNKGLEPVSFRRTPGPGASLAEYRAEDVLRAFHDRITRVRNKPAPKE